METLSSSLKGDSQQNQMIVGKEFIGNTQIWSGSKNIKPNLSFSKKQQQKKNNNKNYLEDLKFYFSYPYF